MIQQRDCVETFDPSGVGLDNGNFCGLPFNYDSANIILIGVPWEVTVSYHAGTAQGPAAVLAASPQLDLYDFDNPDGWRRGIYMLPIESWILAQNEQLRQDAADIISATEQGDSIASNTELAAKLQHLNHACEAVNQWLYQQSMQALNHGKRVGIIGGDHSVPLGYLQALATAEPNFGILHIDAHADLRHAYQGFKFSHASIMHNVLRLPQVGKLVQVGIRDICQDEVSLIDQSQGRIVAHYDQNLKRDRYSGVPWAQTCQQILADLPQRVYVSFDVDGLDPKLCPHTGTPVPGGLELEEVFYLLRCVVDSGRHIIGFDVSEVGNHDWDGNVAARAVYKLCNLLVS
ncbi:MAG: agmatinase family protein [Cyanobacteria bacterium P01_C01_bin.73]